MSTPTAATDRRAQIYIAIFSAALYAVLLIAPVVGGALTEQFGLSPTQLGALFSVELGAFSLATLPAYLWLQRADLRVVTVLGGSGAVLGNFASGFVDSYPWLVLLRFLTALSAGSISVILLSLAGRTRNPGRSFGVFVVSQLAMGALILALFPLLFAGGPVAHVYWSLAGLTLLCLPAVRLLDGSFMQGTRTRPADDSSRQPAPVRKFVAGLAALLCFYVTMSAVWTFTERIAVAAGNETGQVSTVLAIATVAGAPSALLATVLGDHPRRTSILVGGYLTMIVGIGLLLGGPTLLRFAVAAVVVKFAWTLVLPYLLSLLSELSVGGHVMNTTNLMIGSGFVIGPLLGGLLTDAAGGGFTVLLTVSALGMGLSLLLVLLARPVGAAPAADPPVGGVRPVSA